MLGVNLLTQIGRLSAMLVTIPEGSIRGVGREAKHQGRFAR
jgi:hypothetical protein